jgi:hypothetical protein
VFNALRRSKEEAEGLLQSQSQLRAGTKEGVQKYSAKIGTAPIDELADAGEILSRSIGLLAEEAGIVQRGLNAITDNSKVYLAIHGEGEVFKIYHKGELKEFSHRSLAKYISNNPSFDGKDIVLLSCSDATSAQNLANKLGNNRKVIAWEGEVEVFENGYIKGKGACKEFSRSTNGQPNTRTLTTAETPKGSGNQNINNSVLLSVKSIDNLGIWNPIQRILNKDPTDAMPLDGQLWGIATIENGVIKSLSNKGNTFNEIDFVITTNGELKIGKKHHFLGNATDVEAAGTIKVVHGKIKKITNASGHYFPTIDETNKYPEIFKQLGLNIKGTALEILYLDESGYLRSKIKYITE